MTKISLTEHMQFFHIDKVTRLAWLVHADDSSRNSISSEECNQCLIGKVMGRFPSLNKKFLGSEPKFPVFLI